MAVKTTKKTGGIPEVCACQSFFRSEDQRAKQNFLRKHGDNLPESAIEQMTNDENLDNWVAVCDCDTGEIIAGAHYEQSDWYLYTVKGLAVSEELRGRGLGSKTLGDVADKAMRNPQCLVLAGDISIDNKPSLKAALRQGFEPVGEFCWAKGQQPAEIMHLVKFRPTKDKTCLEP